MLCGGRVNANVRLRSTVRIDEVREPTGDRGPGPKNPRGKEFLRLEGDWRAATRRIARKSINFDGRFSSFRIWKNEAIFVLTISRFVWNNRSMATVSAAGRQTVPRHFRPTRPSEPVEELTPVEALSWCVPRRQLLDGFFV
jgi:hypothetical protein